MLVLGAINWFGNYSHDLAIPSEVRAVQDVIHLLMNHTLISDYLLRPVCVNLLDHLK